MSNKTSDKNVANIEDDVKRCNELIKVEHANWIGISNQLAISHILAELERRNKRIKELEEERDHWHGCFIVAMENSIPKQAVIDKIKENKQILDKTNDGNLRERLYIENGIMKELLEGEK